MTIHQLDETDYPYEIIDADGNVCDSGSRTISWYALRLEQDIIDTFDYLAPTLHINNAPYISLEAFVYFFEMILHNEDSKYYDKKGNLSSGRIPTSDSMLLLSSNLIGKTSFSDGKVSLGYSSFLGYEKGPDKDHPLVIVEEQAAIVRRIYTMFIDGKTPFTIAKTLTEEGIPTPGGKSKWGCTTIIEINNSSIAQSKAVFLGKIHLETVPLDLKP